MTGGRLAAVAAVVVVTVAVLVPLFTFLVAPESVRVTATVASYGAIISTAALVLGVRQLMLDRAALTVRIKLVDQTLIEVFIVNRGRRPTYVREVGIWHVKDPEAKAYWVWFQLGKRLPEPPLPAAVSEGQPIQLQTWAASLGLWLARRPAPAWLFVRTDATGEHWFRLPREIAEVVPDAQEKGRRRLADEEAAKGQPHSMTPSA